MVSPLVNRSLATGDSCFPERRKPPETLAFAFGSSNRAAAGGILAPAAAKAFPLGAGILEGNEGRDLVLGRCGSRKSSSERASEAKEPQACEPPHKPDGLESDRRRREGSGALQDQAGAKC